MKRNKDHYIKTLNIVFEEMIDSDTKEISMFVNEILDGCVIDLISENEEDRIMGEISLAVIKGFIRSHMLSNCPTPLMISVSMMEKVEETVKILEKKR